MGCGDSCWGVQWLCFKWVGVCDGVCCISDGVCDEMRLKHQGVAMRCVYKRREFSIGWDLIWDEIYTGKLRNRVHEGNLGKKMECSE